ncbi:hypothetical protein ABMC88_06810 [Sulfitobacter sp. HNIBRBA2951]|uniref:hypothetical protein n=1 Tax=Sulfitobacter aquimarinus TaxID=3158557 RepID=UPI0032DFFC4F
MQRNKRAVGWLRLRGRAVLIWIKRSACAKLSYVKDAAGYWLHRAGVTQYLKG